MSTSREGPNPLRPYYIPPSIGIPQQDVPSPSSGTGLGIRNGSAASYASSAREIFSDIDYDYLKDSSPTSAEWLQEIINDLLYRYISVLLSQPFDVARTILQVRNQDAGNGSMPVADEMRPRPSKFRNTMYSENYSDDSDQDELTYFTSTAPSATSFSPSRSRRRASNRSLSPPSPEVAQPPAHQLTLKKYDSLMEVISQEWTKEGAWGVWKGSVATFFYTLSSKTIESWSRGVLSAILNIPDTGIAIDLGSSSDILDATYPWASLGLAVAAAVMTGLILSPLDLVRTKLILTPITTGSRPLTHNLRILPSYVCPSSLLIPTILHSLVTPAFTHSTPRLLRSRFGIDPVLTPGTYSFAKLLSRIVELFIKLPLETTLRRGQMAVLASPEYLTEGVDKLETIVEIGPYNGALGTMWSITREEGIREEPIPATGTKAVKKAKKTEKRGQGIEGLWRGWRVGVWGLVGLWTASSIGASGTGTGEF